VILGIWASVAMILVARQRYGRATTLL
jgi:hypothetical protein